jgi:hypothetical protein
MFIVASLAELMSRLVPALLGHAETLGHQIRKLGIAGHARDLLLPQIEIAGGETLQVGRIGRVAHDTNYKPVRNAAPQDNRCGIG